MADKGSKYQDSLLSVSKVPIYAKQVAQSNTDHSLNSMDQHQFNEWPNFKSKETKVNTAKSNIVIHVCDEAKNVKQDFTCPRNLLISEMKYFSDYLSNETDKWEDVDISVHCDVHIFDWLMRYVKQESKNEEKPKLEPANVISILISSEFLKMDKLVQECIFYCYKNISKIIATPCNMNCINDKLVTRMAKLFTHKEVEAIVDKKDKFKSKLFCKKFEELFCPTFGNEDCPSNASTLFRCMYCEKLLISKFHSKIECTPERTIIDGRGNLSYAHSRDNSWDINDYLLYLKSTLKTWRNVYWRIWGTINYLYCSRCEEMFSCTDYSACAFHPQQPVYSDGSAPNNESVAGHFPCCKTIAIKFNPINKSKGCTFRAHLIEFPTCDCQAKTKQSSCTHANDKGIELNSKAVFEQLQAHKDVICVSAKQSKFKNDNVFVTSILSPATLAPPHATVSSLANTKQQDQKQTHRLEMKSTSNRNRRNRVKNFEDEDESDFEESAIVRVVINPTKRNKTGGDKPSPTWDVSLPTRLNQDLQREDDLRRMNELMMTLAKSRVEETQKGENEKLYENAQENSTPGTYHRIEQQLRASILSSRSQNSGSSSSSYGTRQSRVSSVK